MIHQKIAKKEYYLTSNRNIFDVVHQVVNAQENGATIFLPHVCNNIDLFDAGFAAQIAKQYPSVKMDYHLLGKSFLSTNLGYSQIIKVFEEPKYRHKLFIVNMIAQNGIRSHHNNRPLNYFALGQCMYKVSQYIHNNTGFASKTEKIQIHCPRFGSGLAGGNWNFISDLINDVWGRFHVTVYNPSK